MTFSNRIPKEIFQGYRGSINLKKPGTPIDWTPDLLEELEHCANDPIYFGENYMKIVTSRGKLETPELYPYQKDIINSVWKNPATIAECARQSGKALPLDIPIPSPDGWTTMGELKTGDRLFDENGKITTVRSISKTFVNHDCYRLTFDDGTTVDADAQHLWVVERANPSTRSIRTKKLTTQELFADRISRTDSRGKLESKWKIRVSGPVEYETKKVEIDPYLLGIWLGDGHSDSGRFTCHIDDLSHYQKEFGAFEFSENVETRNANVFTGTIYELSPKLRHYNLLKNKHIPKEYLINDVRTRQSLLQGLLDSDGTVEKSGRICLCFSYNKNPQLIEDAHELILSLGMKIQRKEYPKTNSVRLYFMCPKEKMVLFRLPRKNERQKTFHVRGYKTEYRYIRSIEKIDSVPTKCIEVSNDSHLFLCSKFFIPTHNTTALTVIILWYILFHEEKTVAILANKGDTAREILGRIRKGYEHLPDWLQQGVIEWNKGSVELENGSRIIAASTSNENLRGWAIDFLFIDEAAWIDHWDEFWTSIAPTIEARENSRVILVSTVNGLNHFYAYTQQARKGESHFKLISVTWRAVPGRDEKWKKRALALLKGDTEKFAQEYENEYLGSSGTLIIGSKLKQLVAETAIPHTAGPSVKLYRPPKPDRTYALVADVSRGKGLDYSAFQVIDVTEMPYHQALVFRDNITPPSEFAEVVHRFATHYNLCPVLIEINDIGAQVADLLWDDFAYENLLFTEGAGARGKKVTQQMRRNIDRGIRTTKTVKNVGCSLLKLLIEQDQLLIHDQETIHELSTFSKKGTSYQAEEGKHDDLVMCLVLFAWLSEQGYFKQLTNINTLLSLRERTQEEVEEDLIPFGVTMNTPNEQDLSKALELEKMTDELWVLAEAPGRNDPW